MAKKNLIIGFLYSLNWYDVEPFMVSLGRNCTECELLVHYYDQMSAWTLDCIKRYGESKSINVILERIAPELQSKYSGYARFKSIEDFLAAHGDEYSQVLMSDMRDVVIQGSPFEEYAEYDSYLAYSTDFGTIAKSSNARWITQNYGDEVTQQIKHNIPCCAGVLQGTADAVHVGMHELNKYLSRNELNRYAADQATLNYLIYTNRMPVKNLIESSVETGTLASLFFNDTPIVNNKILSHGSKNVPAVAHQYDRHASHVRFVNRFYRLPELPFDNFFDDPKSKVDVINTLLRKGHAAEALEHVKTL